MDRPNGSLFSLINGQDFISLPLGADFLPYNTSFVLKTLSQFVSMPSLFYSNVNLLFIICFKVVSQVLPILCDGFEFPFSSILLLNYAFQFYFVNQLSKWRWNRQGHQHSPWECWSIVFWESLWCSLNPTFRSFLWTKNLRILTKKMMIIQDFHYLWGKFFTRTDIFLCFSGLFLLFYYNCHIPISYRIPSVSILYTQNDLCCNKLRT